MGCRCQQIRDAISKLPGGKTVVGMLPPLDPAKGQQPTGQPTSQSVTLATGTGQSVTVITTIPRVARTRPAPSPK